MSNISKDGSHFGPSHSHLNPTNKCVSSVTYPTFDTDSNISVKEEHTHISKRPLINNVSKTFYNSGGTIDSDVASTCDYQYKQPSSSERPVNASSFDMLSNKFGFIYGLGIYNLVSNLFQKIRNLASWLVSCTVNLSCIFDKSPQSNAVSLPTRPFIFSKADQHGGWSINSVIREKLISGEVCALDPVAHKQYPQLSHLKFYEDIEYLQGTVEKKEIPHEKGQHTQDFLNKICDLISSQIDSSINREVTKNAAINMVCSLLDKNSPELSCALAQSFKVYQKAKKESNVKEFLGYFDDDQLNMHASVDAKDDLIDVVLTAHVPFISEKNRQISSHFKTECHYALKVDSNTVPFVVMQKNELICEIVPSQDLDKDTTNVMECMAKNLKAEHFKRKLLQLHTEEMQSIQKEKRI